MEIIQKNNLERFSKVKISSNSHKDLYCANTLFKELKHNITFEVAKRLKDFTIISDMKLVLLC
jgi:hypothetical protein